MAKFQKGDKVQIISDCQSYGSVGTVIHWWRNLNNNNIYVEVELDNGGVHNYNATSLILADINEQYNITNKGDNENMLMGNYRVAKIRFLEGRNTNAEYYYALFDNEIENGDSVVVMSAHNGMGIAVVTDIVKEPTQSMLDFCNAGREVIAKFDMSAYHTRKENRKQAKELKIQMDKKMKEIQELTLYEMMAEKSPELKEMLEAYKGLVG